MSSSALTGGMLFAVLAGLSAFSARKRLPMLPLGRASTWLLLHVVGGTLAAALFCLHVRSAWPLGLYERALALAFYLATASGAAGWVLQKIYPPLLTATGVEVLYERIPEEIAKLREQAEGLVLACTSETGSDTVARHYMESMDWFFRRPRFMASHALGGESGKRWVRQRSQAAGRYVDEKERVFLERLTRLAYYKNDVDFHHAAQSVMKGWLLIHVPLVAALMALAVWHVVLASVYAL